MGFPKTLLPCINIEQRGTDTEAKQTGNIKKVANNTEEQQNPEEQMQSNKKT